jgi:hypothetical protein
MDDGVFARRVTNGSAAAVLRVVAYEAKDGRTHFAYDRPSSCMDRLGNGELGAAARKLDAKLAALADRVTGA